MPITNVPQTIATTEGKPFVMYSGREGVVTIERIRSNGHRDSKSIFQFEVDVLLTALLAVGAIASHTASTGAHVAGAIVSTATSPLKIISTLTTPIKVVAA